MSIYPEYQPPIVPGEQRRISYDLWVNGDGVLDPDETVSTVEAVTEPSGHGDLTMSNEGASSEELKLKGRIVPKAKAVQVDVALDNNASADRVYRVLFKITTSKNQTIKAGVSMMSVAADTVPIPK
jgi:hypothetical protein